MIIAGGRDFNNYKLLKSECSRIINKIKNNIEIVSGGASGADTLGIQYAKEMKYKLTVFPADWNKYGKSAGYKRNMQMGEYADILIAFWDKVSKGTSHMINISKNLGLITYVIHY